MCEHKNLRTVGDRLFCKDCKQELPLEFLTGIKNLESREITPADIVADAPMVVMDEMPVTADIPQEAPQDEQDKGGNAPVAEEPAKDTPKKKPAKTGRKTAKKGE